MPPNPPSNSRQPRLAVWSGYGTEFYSLELYYIHFEIAQFERPAYRILVSMYIVLILEADFKKSGTGNVFTYPDFCPCAKKNNAI